MLDITGNRNWLALVALTPVLAITAGCAGYRETPPPERAPVETEGYYDMTERRAEEILCHLETRLGDDHPGLIDPLMTLSMVYFRQGRQQESDELLQRVWDLIEKNPELTVEDVDLPVRYGSLPAAARAADRLDVRTHLAKSANVNSIDAQGRTALHHAAINGDLEMAKTLISKGAIVTMRDRERQTARDYARGFEHEEIVYLLEPSRVAELRPEETERVEPPPDAEFEFDDIDWFDAPAADEPVIDDVFTDPVDIDHDFFH